MKVQEVEKILDSREKIEYYRTKMQELVSSPFIFTVVLRMCSLLVKKCPQNRQISVV